MGLLFALFLSFILLVFSALTGYFIAYPLLVSLLLISAVLHRQGFFPKQLFQMALTSSKKALPVLNILLLIGVVTAVWMAAGTVPALVYYGMQILQPSWFILAAFVLTSLVSVLIGTSFGTASTIGVALMIMARSSAVDPHWVAGAIIAGAYFGDRCSPMSSSAHLVATLTRTHLYTNLRNMVATGWMPLLLSALLYLGLSWLHPVQVIDRSLAVELNELFDLNGITLLPALTMLVLALLRVEVKRSMLLSIAVGVGLAIGLQGYSVLQVLTFAVAGFRVAESSPIPAILLGGGMVAMAKVCLVVVISTAMAGVLSGTHALKRVEDQLQRVQSRSDLFLGTTLVGAATAAFGCTQTIAILLTQQLVEPKYLTREKFDDEEKVDDRGRYQLASDLENTVVVLAPLIPWNIAGLVPATVLQTDWGFMPYAFYLYLIPLLTFLKLRSGQE